MALFDFLKKKNLKKDEKLRNAPTQSGNTPFYSEFGANVYASDIVMQSIRCKATEFKKLRPRHITDKYGKQTIIYDSTVARIMRKPNAYMTTADFLEKITILLELTKNVFIYPEYYLNKAGERVYTSIYPLRPAQVTYLVDAKENYYVNLQFNSGYEVTLPKEDIIHWRKDYGVNDYFGGNGFADKEGLLTALDTYNKLCQSIAKAIEVSCKVNGILRVNTYLDDESTDAKREEFINKLENNESGLLVEDLKTEYTALPHDVKLVDAETLKFFYETICRANGTSLAILNGDYTKAQKEAYYEHALEADIISLGQAMTDVLFTDRERSYGNELTLYPRDINFMSMENKIAALQSGLPAGIFTKNEARELLGYPPIEGGDVMPRGYNEIDNGTEGGADSNESAGLASF